MDLLRLESEEINLSFRKASIEGEGTSQEIADRREEALVSAFISKYFPFPYRIVKGNIVDSDFNRSCSIDSIVLNPSHPYTIDPKNNKASIILADGVDFAIEVKPDLSKKDELIRSLEQIRSVKKLRRKRHSNNLSIFNHKYTDKQKDAFYRLPTFIFSNKTYKDIKTLISNIYKYYMDENVPLEEQFDFIIVNNRCIVMNSYESSYGYISPHKGILFSETNEDTLAMFLLYLSNLPKSEMEIGPSVLSFYLSDDVLVSNLKTFHSLNEVYFKALDLLNIDF